MQSDRCQFIYDNMAAASIPDTSRTFWWNLRRQIWNTVIQGPIDFLAKTLRTKEPFNNLKRHLWQMGLLGISEYIWRVLPTTRPGRALFGRRRKQTNSERSKQKLNLQPGDLVGVKPFEEIFATLNSEGKHRGLAFTKEMMKYCGRRFRVHKRLEKIILESTGEMRTMRTPTVILENVFCDGEAHGHCDRTCFCFWREAWLNPLVSSNEQG